MKAMFVTHCISFIIGVMLANHALAAANSLNEPSYSRVKLPSDWKLILEEKNPAKKVKVYHRARNKINQRFTEVVLTKPAPIGPDNIAEEFYAEYIKPLQREGCQVEPLKPIIPGGTPFKEWVITYECEEPAVTGTTVFVDADMMTAYLFAYRSEETPATTVLLQQQMFFMKDHVEICYPRRGCYRLQ